MRPTDQDPGTAADADFRKLWAAQAISQVGSRITRGALPLAAVMTLGATPAQMGILGALETAPALLVGLAAGVYVDRFRRRPLLMLTDLGRALLLATIPLAAALGTLGLPQLYLIALLTGVLTVVFDIAYPSYMPTLVGRERMLEANSRLGISSSIAEMSGPALGGWLVQVLTAPFAILVDAVSFVISALFLVRIRTPEPKPEPRTEHVGVLPEALAGLRAIFREPRLRALVGAATTQSLFGGFFMALFSLFTIRELGLSPTVQGLVIATGGVGELFGALAAGRVARRYGMRRALIGTVLIGGLGTLAIPLAGWAGSVTAAALLLVAAQLIDDPALTIFHIHALSLRQTIAEPALLGRVNAGAHFCMMGALPAGALLGGLLGEAIGMQPTLFLGGLGITASAIWLLRWPDDRAIRPPSKSNRDFVSRYASKDGEFH
ncbi:MAG: MFS transporter [Actinomycetota bacterium]